MIGLNIKLKIFTEQNVGGVSGRAVIVISSVCDGSC